MRLTFKWPGASTLWLPPSIMHQSIENNAIRKRKCIWFECPVYSTLTVLTQHSMCGTLHRWPVQRNQIAMGRCFYMVDTNKGRGIECCVAKNVWDKYDMSFHWRSFRLCVCMCPAGRCVSIGSLIFQHSGIAIGFSAHTTQTSILLCRFVNDNRNERITV